jgi:tRNA-dihydrouridine synthase
VRERVTLAKRQLRLSLALKGAPRGIFEMRRHLSCYFKGLPDFKDTRIRLVTSIDPDEVLSLLDSIADRWGDAPLDSDNVYSV